MKRINIHYANKNTLNMQSTEIFIKDIKDNEYLASVIKNISHLISIQPIGKHIELAEIILLKDGVYIFLDELEAYTIAITPITIKTPNQ